MQEALKIAADWKHVVREIRIAKGLYTPAEPNGPREASFQLISNVAIKGGYAGCGEPDPNAPDIYLDPNTRDIDLYETILSGDLNGDDANMTDLCDYLTDPNRVDNSYHVVTATHTDANTVLDGFTISGGTANGADYRAGGGMHIYSGNPKIIRCTFKGNAAENKGGGIHCYKSDPSIRNCTFRQNLAGLGGGISCDCQSSPSITNNQIKGNRAGNHGGGIYCENSSEPNILRNRIVDNKANDGGGIYCSGSNPNILNNIIEKNTALDDGGGICCEEDSSPTIRNNTIVQNRANPQGGGIFCEDSEPMITNCIIWENGDDLHNYSSDSSGEDCNARYCCIEDEDGSKGLGNISLDPYFVDPDNGDYHLKSYSPCIDAGDPNSDYSMEPAPNGERANMGAYGNTKEAATKSDDLDGDGMPDGEDSDGDGLPDGWEMAHFGNISTESNEDTDGDNLTNLQEYEAGTDPHVAYDGLKDIVFVSIYNPGDPNADGTRHHPFPTIQQGIDAAQEEAIILVTEGTFEERLIIDGKVLYIYGGYDQYFTSIEYYTILNTHKQSRALLYVNVPGGMLSGFLITNCYERDGGGMYFFNSSPIITDNFITGNETQDDGGGISCYFGSTPLFEHNVIADNYANDNAGGIYCRNAAPTFRSCLITGNEAKGDGGGIRLRNSKPLITDCDIVDNFAGNNGGGILCRQGSVPNIINCNIWNNTADGGNGGGIRSVEDSSPTISDCRIEGNSPDGVWMNGGEAQIEGMVEIISNNWESRDLEKLYGDGELHTASGVVLKIDDCNISRDLTGEGILEVASESKLTIEGENTYVNMTEPGGIRSKGLLVIKDSVCVEGSRIDVIRASFEGDVNITNSVIRAEAGAPYGQFFIEDTVEIIGNDIHADGDRYMDLDPSVFDGLVENNRIYVRITEGKNQNRGGLFELRGQDDLVSSACGDDEFLCKVDLGTIPDFDLKSWTLEELTLEDGAKVNLTNRFDFQPPYDSGGDDEEEVLYVRKLVLGEGAVLNTAFNQIYYETLIGDPCEVVKHVPLLGFSLNNIAFDDEDEFVTRIVHNNFVDPNADESADYTRIHVKRVENLEPDPNGMMRMCNLPDSNQETVNARAKGLFAKSNEEEILIQFEYLFDSSDPDPELVIYLTDVPEFMEHYDSDRQAHYIEVARLPVPPTDRPGSPGSGRFGVFHKYVSRGELDFVKGTRIELELVGPADACVLINNLDPLVISCSDLYCGDVDGEQGVNVIDFLMVIASVGLPVEISDETSTTCLEFGFSVDGRVDTLDVSARAWMLGLEEPLNLCDTPLTTGMATVSAATGSSEGSDITRLFSLEPPDIHLDALLVTGKRGTSDLSARLEDNLYVLDANGQYVDKLEPEPNHSNGKLVQDSAGEIYQVNHGEGLLRLSNGDCNIPPAGFPIDNDPRYDLPAQVSIGLGREWIYSDRYEDFIWAWVGRPILDAAFDADGYVYVVPVVVDPNGHEPYVVAAKLQLLGTEDPPYRVVKLYDDPPPPGDNQYLNNLREIEIDRAGNLYVINTDNLNEGDILWVYDTETKQVKRRVTLGNSHGDCHVPAPVTMHVSNTKDRLYLASSKNDPNANSDSLYVLSKQYMNIVRTIEINGMGHITDITEDPITGTLWVVGFTMSEIPDYIYSDVEPFYEPYLAKIPYGSSSDEPVEAMCLSDPISYPDNDLALPLSIIWTATEEKRENFVDFALFATHWLESSCTSPDWCDGADFTGDGNVTMEDLLMLCNNWLEQNP